MRSQQMPLRLPHPAQYGRESFVVGRSNAAALDVILHAADPVILLSGPEGSGKTHLAHIWAEHRGAAILAASAFAPRDDTPFFAGRALVVEDIHEAGLSETALFHLVNSSREGGVPLMLTARHPAAELPIALPDLASRLRLARPAVLLPPDEDLLRPVLVKLFADRQLLVDRAVVDYVMPRIDRSFAAIAEVVDRLDHAGLAEGRAITRPMAARILDEIDSRKQAFMEFD